MTAFYGAFCNNIRALGTRLAPKGSFARGTAVLTSGTAAGQAVVVLASPLLTRLYNPEEFGVLAVYSAFLSVIVVVASLRYQLAIPLPSTDGSAANVLVLSLICVAGVTLLTALAVCLWGGRFADWAKTPSLAAHLWLLPVGVGLGGCYQAFNYWAVRKKAFGRIAKTKFQQGLGLIITQIGGGFFFGGAVALILGQVVGQAAGLSRLAKSAFAEDRKALARARCPRVRRAARRYKDFPLFSTTAAFSNTASTYLPHVMLAALFSPAVAGFYLITTRIMSTPMSLVGKAVGQVFHSRAAEAHRSDCLPETVLTSFEALVRFFVGPIIVMTFVAPQLFGLIFGSSWRHSGLFFQLLAPMMIVNSVFSPLSVLGSVLEQLRIVLLFQLGLLGARITGILTGFWIGNPEAAVFCFSIFSSVIYVLWIRWIFSVAGVEFKRLAAIFGLELVFGLAAGAFLYGINILSYKTIADRFFLRDSLIIGFSLLAIFMLLSFRALPFWRKKLK